MDISGFVGDPKFERSRERRKEGKGGKRYWNWLSCWALERDVNYLIRFVAHHSILPGGIHPYTVHKLHQHPGDEEPMKLLCTESYETVRKDTNPHTGAVEIVKKDCFFCDLMAELEELGEGKTLSHLQKSELSLYEAIEAMSPFQCRTYLLPAILGAREVKNSDDSSEWVADPTTLTPIIFAAREFDGQTEACPGGIMHRLTEFQRPVPHLDHPQYGNWLTVTNVSGGGGYHFTGLQPASDIAQSIPNWNDIYDKYPNVRKYGQTAAKHKKPIAHSYDYAKYAYMRSWHGLVMAQRFGLDVSAWHGGT